MKKKPIDEIVKTDRENWKFDTEYSKTKMQVLLDIIKKRDRRIEDLESELNIARLEKTDYKEKYETITNAIEAAK